MAEKGQFLTDELQSAIDMRKHKSSRKTKIEPINSLNEKQVVSKKRVSDHGEVYTASREVNAMIDLVKQETERIDSRFLEPACGTGNFLAEVLERKLRVVESSYGKRQLEYERNAVLAVSSIYGIDILEDNVVECRKRLFGIFDRYYSNFFKKDCLNAIKYILKRNIIWGDALHLKTVGKNPQPIVFSEWSFPFNDSTIKRRDFTFHELLSYAHTREQPLFSDLGEEVFFPEPVKEYPPIHFLRVADAEQQ
ncbi:MAG: DNA methyltransferase [Sedimentisphaerales bacterium]